MILVVFIAVIFLVLLAQFSISSTLIIGKNLFQNLILLVAIVVVVGIVPNSYGVLSAIIIYAIYNLVAFYTKKIAKL
jgi:hypothetical protein